MQLVCEKGKLKILNADWTSISGFLIDLRSQYLEHWAGL